MRWTIGIAVVAVALSAVVAYVVARRRSTPWHCLIERPNEIAFCYRDADACRFASSTSGGLCVPADGAWCARASDEECFATFPACGRRDCVHVTH